MAVADPRWLKPYLLRTVRIGARAAALALLAVLIFRLLPGGDVVAPLSFAILWSLAAVWTALIWVLPWKKLFVSNWGPRAMYLWSLGNIALITAVLVLAGPNHPSLFLLYCLTTVFFAAVYPPRIQVILFLFTSVAYLGAALLVDEPTSVADNFLRLAALGIVAILASFLSRELMQRMKVQDRAHEELSREFVDLQHAEELFRAVSELASDYVYSMRVEEDGSSKWEWASDAYERVTGYTLEETEQMGGWISFLHPDDLPTVAENYQKLLAGETRIDELRIITKSGEVRCLRAYVEPVWDAEAGRVVRYYGAVQDITDRKRAENELRSSNSLLQATLESTADGILVVDLEGKIVASNERFMEMWRIPRDVLESRDDERALEVAIAQLNDPETFMEKVRSLYEDQTAESFDTLNFKDGRIIERFSRPQRVEGQVVGRVWSFRDATERIQGEEKIRVALEALQRADAQRRELLANLVRAKEDERGRLASDIHDDSIQVMTSIAVELERHARKTDDPRLKASLTSLEESLRSAIGRLRAMIFGLKPLALIEEGLRSALYLLLEGQRQDTGIEFELRDTLTSEPPDEVRVALYRIAQEALANARKHAEATKICVHLFEADGGITLQVEDDGRGFDVQTQGVLVPGHIGLTEMRERAEMIGGRFRIGSAEPRGVIVEVWVPNSVAHLEKDQQSLPLSVST